MPINKKAELELASELVNILKSKEVADEFIATGMITTAACPCSSYSADDREDAEPMHSDPCGPDCQCPSNCECKANSEPSHYEGTMSGQEVEEKKELELFTKIKQCIEDVGSEVENAEDQLRQLMQMPEHRKVAVRVADKLDISGYHKTAGLIDKALKDTAKGDNNG